MGGRAIPKPIDAIGETQMDRLGAHPAAGAAVLLAAQADGVQAGLPALVQALGKGGEWTGRRLPGADAPDAYRVALVGQFPNQTGAGDGDVIQVRREKYPAHGKSILDFGLAVGKQLNARRLDACTCHSSRLVLSSVT